MSPEDTSVFLLFLAGIPLAVSSVDVSFEVQVASFELRIRTMSCLLYIVNPV